MKRTHLFALILSVLGLSVLFMSFSSFDPPTQGQAPVGGQKVYDANGKLLKVRYIRKNAHEDSENMQILADALKKMKEMDCANPMSWYMQGAIHGAPYAKNEFCPDYLRAKNDAWHNCTHESDPLGLTQDGARMHFYTWHKMYLNHFEEVIRYVSGKPNFTLPYWEYDNTKYQTLPELLLDKNSSLYESWRSKHMNDGKSIEIGFFNNERYNYITDFTSPKEAFETDNFHFFTRHLEGVPHNKMHIYLGKFSESNPTQDSSKTRDPIGDDVYGYMYQNYSPMDPVFWIHHANIDRLYEKWLIKQMENKYRNNGRPGKNKFINDPWFYRFFKAGDKELTYYNDLGKVFDEMFGVQDYAYDMFIKNGTYNKRYETKVETAIRKNLWGKSPFETVNVLVANHDSNIPVGRDGDPEFTVKFILDDPDIKNLGNATWVLDMDVDFAKKPEGIFTVAIRDADLGSVKNPYELAGTMSFFGVGHHHDNTDDEQHDHAGRQHEVSFEFDISEEIDFEKFTSTGSRNMGFQIIPSDPRDQVFIDKIQLVKQIVTR